MPFYGELKWLPGLFSGLDKQGVFFSNGNIERTSLFSVHRECGGQPNLTDETTILIAVGEGPDCSQATPSISKLWPPNHKMKEIDVLGVTNTQDEPAEITIIGITQDEPVNGLGDGDISPDGMGVGTSTAQVRAERSGTGNGRVYEISFIAVDDSGAECVGSVHVSVPHDKKIDAIDDGQHFDSTEID